MRFPRMSLHIGDYKKDTGNLRATGHGAYLLLIMHYWSTGALPDDDRQLAAIVGMSDREWKQWKPILQAFFRDGWKHKRIDAELLLAQKNYDARAAAGSKGGNAKAKAQQKGSNARAGPAVAMLQQTASKKVAKGQQNCSPALATLTLTNKDSLRESSRARARESENPSVLKEESEAKKEKRARVQADTPQWDAWQKHLKAQKGKGSPCDKQFGWYFPTEWPPGYQPP